MTDVCVRIRICIQTWLKQLYWNELGKIGDCIPGKGVRRLYSPERNWEKEIKMVRLKVSLILFLIYLFDVSFAASSSFLSLFSSLLILSCSWKIFVIILRFMTFFFDSYFHLISVLFIINKTFKMIIVIFLLLHFFVLLLLFFFLFFV